MSDKVIHPTRRRESDTSADGVSRAVFVPNYTGEADFVSKGTKCKVVRFYLRGTYSSSVADVKLLKIYVSGKAGRLGKDQKLDPLGDVDGPKGNDRSWAVGPSNIEKDPKKPKLEFGNKVQDYTVRLDFEYQQGKNKPKTESRTWWISTLADPTPARRMQDIEEDDVVLKPLDILTFNGTGTFYGAQRIAIYDFDVTFTNGPTMIEVFAGPTDNPTARIDDAPQPQSPWHRTGIVGRYNGTSDTYYLKAVATYQNSSSTMTKMFSNILANQGVTIPMSSWTLLE